jgi:predicted kinase
LAESEIGSVSYYVIVRGPLGVGKTACAERLAQQIGAEYISIDRILDEHGLWESGRLSEFLRANRVAAARAQPCLARGRPVVFDGNFYWRSQLKDLIGRLPYPHYVYTLEAPLTVCIERDRRRDPPHGEQGARAVYAKSTRFAYGIAIDANRPIAAVVRDLRSRIPGRPRRR